MGKKGIWASKSEKIWYTKLVFKKNCFRFIALCLTTIFIHIHCKEAKRIFHEHKKTHPHNEKPVLNKEHHNRRHLQAFPDFRDFDLDQEIKELKSVLNQDVTKHHHGFESIFNFKGDDEHCRTHADQNSCDADNLCSWCVSAAVKPACNSLESAKSLPPAVFKCDKVTQEESPVTKIVKKVESDIKSPAFKSWMKAEDDCRSHADQNSCDADDGCSWCISAAVKPACNSIESAKQLPPAVFSCDKIKEEIEPDVPEEPVELNW
jgi:hypothetical protein